MASVLQPTRLLKNIGLHSLKTISQAYAKCAAADDYDNDDDTSMKNDDDDVDDDDGKVLHCICSQQINHDDDDDDDLCLVFVCLSEQLTTVKYLRLINSYINT